MKKRILTMLLALATLFSLTACGGNAPAGDAPKDSVSQPESGTTAEVPAEQPDAAVPQVPAEIPTACAAESFQPDGNWYIYSYCYMDLDRAAGTLTLIDAHEYEVGTEPFTYDEETGEITVGEEAVSATVSVNEFGVLCMSGPFVEAVFGQSSVVMAGESDTFDGNGRWILGFSDKFSHTPKALTMDESSGMTIYCTDLKGNWEVYDDYGTEENMKFGWLKDSNALITFTDEGIVSNEWPITWVNGLGATLMYNHYVVLTQAPDDFLDSPIDLELITT